MSDFSIFQTQLANHFGISVDTSSALTKLRFPFWALVFYICTLKLFEPKEETAKEGNACNDSSLSTSQPKVNEPVKAANKNKNLDKIQWLILSHNLLLCIFSFLTFYNTFPLIFNLFRTYGFRDAITNGEFEKLYDGTYGYWSHLFYLSKFYEFADTWIVLLRGKKPIFLQVFHHIGAVIGMWLITITKCTSGYLFVVENSFIHTIMYLYYARSILGIQCKNKHFITIAQITQFFLGTTGGIVQYILCGTKMRWEDKFALLYNEIYVFSLIYLFYNFYQQTYKSPRKNKQA